MSDTTSTSFRVGEQTHGIVRSEIVEHSDSYDSITEFYETAVRGNIRSIANIGVGGKQARDLIYLLNEIRRITVPIPEDDSRAFILSGELSHIRPRIELPSETLNSLAEVKGETGLSQSELIRRCIFRQLNRLTHGSNHLEGWREDEVQKTWEEVRAGLERPKFQCYDVLRGRFVDEQKATRRKIEADPGGFDLFADEYVNRFYGSDCYNQLVESRSDHTFTVVDNLIEEYTDYKVSAGNAGRGAKAPGVRR